KMHFRLFPKRTVTHRFLKMLLYRRGNMSFVFVKRKYSFWPSAEVEILRFQHKLDEMVNLCRPIPRFEISVNFFEFSHHFRIERKFLQSGEENPEFTIVLPVDV